MGHLQSNKAGKAVAPFAWIHAVDSLDLLRRLDAAACDQGTVPNLLVQVDLAGEVTKHGASLDVVREIVDSATACRAARVCGLMLLPPLAEDPEQARPYFRRLRELRGRAPGCQWRPVDIAAPVDGNEPRFRGRHRGGRHHGPCGQALFGGGPELSRRAEESMSNDGRLKAGARLKRVRIGGLGASEVVRRLAAALGGR